MAGSNPAFNAAAFRTAIRNTMTMGSPNNPAERATFRWKIEREFDIDDPAHKPYDWTSTPTNEITHPDVQVPVAVEFSARPSGSNQTQMGEFDTSRAVITILDEDYVKVQGADVILLGGNAYGIQFVGPPMGLFEVTVYQIFCEAVDET
jgi:hypothetical protein